MKIKIACQYIVFILIRKKVVDLKRELKSRGLSVTGNKDELVERLKTYTQNLLGTGSGKRSSSLHFTSLRKYYHIFFISLQILMGLGSQ